MAARVLEARNFPLARLAHDLDLLAATVTEHHPEESALHALLLGGGGFARSHDTSLR